VSPNCSRRLLMAWATRAVTLSAIVDNLAPIVYDRPYGGLKDTSPDDPAHDG
jgi:hypothetical protein